MHLLASHDCSSINQSLSTSKDWLPNVFQVPLRPHFLENQGQVDFRLHPELHTSRLFSGLCVFFLGSNQAHSRIKERLSQGMGRESVARPHLFAIRRNVELDKDEMV